MTWTIVFDVILETIKKAAIALVKSAVAEPIALFNKGKTLFNTGKEIVGFAKSKMTISQFAKEYWKTNVSDVFAQKKEYFTKVLKNKKWRNKFIKTRSYRLLEEQILNQIPGYKLFKRIRKRINQFLEQQYKERARLLKNLRKLERDKLNLLLWKIKQQQKILKTIKKLEAEIKKKLERELRTAQRIQRLENEFERRQSLIRIRELQKKFKIELKYYEKVRKEIFKQQFDKDLSSFTQRAEDFDEAGNKRVFEWDTYDYHEFIYGYLDETERNKLEKWVRRKTVYVKDKPLPLQGQRDIGNKFNYTTLNSEMMKFKSSWIKEAQWVPIWVFKQSGMGFNPNYNSLRTRGMMKLKLKKVKKVKLPAYNKAGIYVWWNISLGTFKKIIQDPTGTNFWKVFYKKNRKKLIYITTQSKHYTRKNVFTPGVRKPAGSNFKVKWA